MPEKSASGAEESVSSLEELVSSPGESVSDGETIVSFSEKMHFVNKFCAQRPKISPRSNIRRLRPAFLLRLTVELRHIAPLPEKFPHPEGDDKQRDHPPQETGIPHKQKGKILPPQMAQPLTVELIHAHPAPAAEALGEIAVFRHRITHIAHGRKGAQKLHGVGGLGVGKMRIIGVEGVNLLQRLKGEDLSQKHRPRKANLLGECGAAGKVFRHALVKPARKIYVPDLFAQGNVPQLVPENPTDFVGTAAFENHYPVLRGNRDSHAPFGNLTAAPDKFLLRMHKFYFHIPQTVRRQVKSAADLLPEGGDHGGVFAPHSGEDEENRGGNQFGFSSHTQIIRPRRRNVNRRARQIAEMI